ncbi:MAG: hypothetical protein LBJ92_03930 [Holosporales bacterium]|jgi:lysozyme family protein|nr:hypothetical protein [Holosporales bacterium]
MKYEIINLRILMMALLCLVLAGCSPSKFGQKFDYALSKMLGNGGGYINNPDDPGGETKFGITKKSYPNVNIANLTIDQAKQIYYRDYWSNVMLHQVCNQDVATKIFDIVVNFGDEQAQKIVTRALKSAYKKPHLLDGNNDWIKVVRLVNSVHNSRVLLAALRSEQAAVYRLITQKKERMRKFMNIWLNKAYS